MEGKEEKVIDKDQRYYPKLHNGQFDYRTGKALRSPACDDLKTYRVKVENNVVFIDVDS